MSTTTIIIILLSSAVVVLVLLVVWLIWRNQRQSDELQKKNEVIVRNVKVFKQGEDTTGKPAYFAQGSYEYNEKAVMTTNEGTYTLTFEYVDPNNWNKLLARGTINNIKVKQGKTQASATTVVSTAEAEVTPIE